MYGVHDLLDGLNSLYFASASHDHDDIYVNEDQLNSVTSGMIVDGTITGDDINTTTSLTIEDITANGKVEADAFFGDGGNLTNLTPDDDWSTSGDDIYRETGNVGIGTNSPGAKLEIDSGPTLGSILADARASNHEIAPHKAILCGVMTQQ